MFYTVFSTSDNPAMQWQSELLEHSWKDVRQEGALIRLVATDDPQHLPRHRYAQTVPTSPWNVHPVTGDDYVIYNKPASLLEWLIRERPEGTVLLLDPDCVFRKPVTRRVPPGAPVSQTWIGLTLAAPSKKRPFGFPDGFSFLNDYCARTNIASSAVMIPTLIHTSDLRRICARWLELCGHVRDHYRDVEGRKIREADMFAYVAASAEYGLQHEPAALGVCTNWDPADAPDAPIIHYCQSIVAADGRELFNKYSYQPGNALDTSAVPLCDYGNDLVAIVNDFVEKTYGVVTPPSPRGRPSRCDDVLEGRVVDDILLEVPPEGRSVWLNSTGKAVWDMCDGSRTVDEIGAALSDRFDAERAMVTAQVTATITQLRSAGLLKVR